MRISEDVVAAVVAEVSRGMSDPRYTQTAVGGWVHAQPNATRYLTAHARELGGADAVVNAVFHASILASPTFDS